METAIISGISGIIGALIGMFGKKWVAETETEATSRDEFYDNLLERVNKLDRKYNNLKDDYSHLREDYVELKQKLNLWINRYFAVYYWQYDAKEEVDPPAFHKMSVEEMNKKKFKSQEEYEEA